MEMNESLRIVSMLLEFSIKGVSINDEEKITACGVRNIKTGEVIACDWHADGREEAWDRGWYAPFLERLANEDKKIPDSLRQLDNMYDYEVLNEFTEDGFLTTKDRFLTRTEALDLARQTRQLNKNRLGHSWDEEDPYLRAEEVDMVADADN
jgi:hypothetical protein